MLLQVQWFVFSPHLNLADCKESQFSFLECKEIISRPLGDDVAVEDNQAMVSSRWVNFEGIREIYDQIMKDKIRDPDAVFDLEAMEKEAALLLLLKTQTPVTRPDIVLDTNRLYFLANLHYSLVSQF